MNFHLTSPLLVLILSSCGQNDSQTDELRLIASLESITYRPSDIDVLVYRVSLTNDQKKFFTSETEARNRFYALHPSSFTLDQFPENFVVNLPSKTPTQNTLEIIFLKK